MINNHKTNESAAVHIKERLIIRDKETKEILLEKVENVNKGTSDDTNK